MNMTKIDLAFAHHEPSRRAKQGVSDIITDARSDFGEFVDITKVDWNGDRCAFEYRLFLRKLLSHELGTKLLKQFRAGAGLIQTFCGFPSEMLIMGGLQLQPGLVIINAEHSELSRRLRLIAEPFILGGTEKFIVQRADRRGFEITPTREVFE